jgi:hypothetical protein
VGFRLGLIFLCKKRLRSWHAAIIHNFVGIGPVLILTVDGEGKKCRIISGPWKPNDRVFVGQSQGHLHYMSEYRDDTRQMTELSIWVLQDYHTEE